MPQVRLLAMLFCSSSDFAPLGQVHVSAPITAQVSGTVQQSSTPIFGV